MDFNKNAEEAGKKFVIGLVGAIQDIGYGAQRTAEGLGISGEKRQIEIANENDYLFYHISEIAVRAHNSIDHPLFKLTYTILEDYFNKIPKDLRKSIFEKVAANFGGYVSGRIVAGTIVSLLVNQIVRSIIHTSVYQQLFRRALGVKHGMGGKGGVFIPIGMLIGQGMAQRASMGSKNCASKYPSLFNLLRSKYGLDMLFFLVEKPLEDYLLLIECYAKNPTKYNNMIEDLKLNYTK